MSSGFTKTFRLIALVLLLCVTQVYVLAHPSTTSTTASLKTTATVNQPVVTDHQLNFIKQNQVTSQTQLASEHAITFAPKSPLSLAFTKGSAEKLAAKTTFLKVKKGTYDPLMAKGAPMARPQDDSGDNDEGDRKALYITSAIVIGAAVALFFAFRSNRDNDGIRGN